MSEVIRSLILKNKNAIKGELVSLFKLDELNAIPEIRVDVHGDLCNIVLSLTDLELENLSEYSVISIGGAIGLELSEFLDPRIPLSKKIHAKSPATPNEVFQVTFKRIHSLYGKRQKAKILDLSLDLETTGFNKPFLHNGSFLHGAKHNGIMEVGAILSDPDVQDRDNVISTFSAMLNISESTSMFFSIDNTMFQNRTGFSQVYQEALEKGWQMDLAEAQKSLILMLRDACELFNRELKPYSYDAPVKFRLVGKSVAFDLDFIQQQMPELSQYISHEILDVSVVKNIFRHADKRFNMGLGQSEHFAMSDAKLALNELNLAREVAGKLLSVSGAKNMVELNKWLDTLKS